MNKCLLVFSDLSKAGLWRIYLNLSSALIASSTRCTGECLAKERNLKVIPEGCKNEMRLRK